MLYRNISERYGNDVIVSIEDYRQMNPSGVFEESATGHGCPVIIERFGDTPGDYEVVARANNMPLHTITVVAYKESSDIDYGDLVILFQDNMVEVVSKHMHDGETYNSYYKYTVLVNGVPVLMLTHEWPSYRGVYHRWGAEYLSNDDNYLELENVADSFFMSVENRIAELQKADEEAKKEKLKLDAERKIENERKEYERLKSKFEGKDNA